MSPERSAKDGATLTVEGWTPAGQFYRIQRGGALGWVVDYFDGDEHVEREDHASLEAASHAVSLGALPDA